VGVVFWWLVSLCVHGVGGVAFVDNFDRSTSMEMKSPTRSTASSLQRTNVRLLDNNLMVEPLTKTLVLKRLARLAERRARIPRTWFEGIDMRATEPEFVL
jgi:hypothetical protein